MTNPLENDLQWAHIHANATPAERSTTVTIQWQPYGGSFAMAGQPMDLRSGLEVQYTVNGHPVSGWIAPGASNQFSAVIDVCQFITPSPSNPCSQTPNVATLFPDDGVFELSCDIRWSGAAVIGPNGLMLTADKLNEYYPIPGYLHLNRGQQHLLTSPLTNPHVMPTYFDRQYGSIVDYVDSSSRVYQDHPLDPAVERTSLPWTDPNANLFVERMNAHAYLGAPYFMWWNHSGTAPSSVGVFARAFAIKHSSDSRGFLIFNQPQSINDHRKIPAIDGPRGTAVFSNYISGQVDTVGNYYFVETSGRLARLAPDGSVLTIVGHRVKAGKDPVWWQKDMARVLDPNIVEFRGQWPVSIPYGTGPAREFPGMRLPLDLAIDSDNQNILYVAAYYDHCIYKVDATDPDNAIVTVLAGDPNTPFVESSTMAPRGGFKDGMGTNALFDGPCSLVFCPNRKRLYVADQNNNAIREVDRAGNVTTILGGRADLDPVSPPHTAASPVLKDPLPLFTAADYYDSYGIRSLSGVNFEVSSMAAAAGTRPHIYRPQTVRLDSLGRLILNEIGFGSIRRIVVDPNASDAWTTDWIGDIYQPHTGSSRGWAWLDVDRSGAIGPKDNVYFCSFNTGKPAIPGYMSNEVFLWIDKDGPASTTTVTEGGVNYDVKAATSVFGQSNSAPLGLGRLQFAAGGHYPWVVAVDPRGALLGGGVGEFGLSRIRKMRTGPVIDESAEFPALANDPAYSKFVQGRNLVRQGGGSLTTSGCSFPYDTWRSSYEMRLGYGAHGFVGLDDLWAYRSNLSTVTTALPSSVLSTFTTSELSSVEQYLRWAAWDVSTTPVELPQMKLEVWSNLAPVASGADGETIAATVPSGARLDFVCVVPRAASSTTVDFDVLDGGNPLNLSTGNTPFMDASGPLVLPDGSLVYHLMPHALVSDGSTSSFQFTVTAEASYGGTLDEATVTVNFN